MAAALGGLLRQRDVCRDELPVREWLVVHVRGHSIGARCRGQARFRAREDTVKSEPAAHRGMMPSGCERQRESIASPASGDLVTLRSGGAYLGVRYGLGTLVNLASML